MVNAFHKVFDENSNVTKLRYCYGDKPSKGTVVTIEWAHNKKDYWEMDDKKGFFWWIKRESGISIALGRLLVMIVKDAGNIVAIERIGADEHQITWRNNKKEVFSKSELDKLQKKLKENG